MKNVKRFLKRFLTGLTLCFLVFAAVNVGIYFVGIFMTQEGRNKANAPSWTVRQIAESIKGTPKSGYFLPADLQNELKSRDAWAMLLNDNGKVVWKQDLPAELPLDYTSAEIAKFSRYYLKDYPVYCWECGSGLIVIGFPKDAYIKFPVDYSYSQFWFMIHFVELLLAGNIILLILLYAFLSWRTVKPIQPILEGMDLLSRGEPVHLQTKGWFFEIASKINSVSALLQDREAALKKKEKARMEWISGISHDIRTPLSMIMGYAGEMKDDAGLPEPVREPSALICAQAVKLKNLVNDLNLVSRLEYSMQPINSRPLRAAKLIRESVSEYLNGGMEEAFEFETELTDKTVKINGDERLLKRAVANLLQNSVSHNSSGCKIIVSLQTRDNNCIITVSDNGSGITPAQMEQLQKLVNTDRDSFPLQEHGLGLRIVHCIAKAHNGMLQLESQPGIKTSVSIIIPICS